MTPNFFNKKCFFSLSFFLSYSLWYFSLFLVSIWIFFSTFLFLVFFMNVLVKVFFISSFSIWCFFISSSSLVNLFVFYIFLFFIWSKPLLCSFFTFFLFLYPHLIIFLSHNCFIKGLKLLYLFWSIFLSWMLFHSL